MYYLVTIGYETETERGVKTQKVKNLIEAESVEETTIIGNKYIAGDTRTSQLLAINNIPIECIISPTTHPEYYKEKK